MEEAAELAHHLESGEITAGEVKGLYEKPRPNRGHV
jgi:hypothetical protein